MEYSIISPNSKVFIIAELSANHNGSLQTAIETIRAAKRAGADAIKLQTFTPDTITLDCDKKDFQINHGTHWDGQTLYKLYQNAHTPWDWHTELFSVAKDEDLICFSSPFDSTAVDFLESLGSPLYKIASPEITDVALIEYAASKGKPMIFSTGIAELADIELAVKTCRNTGNNEIILLKCTSAYPTPFEEANLVMISDLAKRFGVLSGFSDHTAGITAPVVAVALGAKVIEKHFILDRSIGGPDAFFSLNEAEFTEMVSAVRNAEDAIGIIDYNPTEKMMVSRQFCRSLYISENIKSGEIFTTENIRSVRPGHGLHPKYLAEVLGKTASRGIEKGDALEWDMVKVESIEKHKE